MPWLERIAWTVAVKLFIASGVFLFLGDFILGGILAVASTVCGWVAIWCDFRRTY